MISAAIMAHPRRRAMVNRLVERLPDAAVVWDERGEEWDTGRRALLAYDPAARYHLVVQDDAILSARFLEAVALITDQVEDQPVGLYVGRCRPRRRLVQKAVHHAIASGSPWLEAPGGPWWGVAIAVPVAVIPSLVAFADLDGHRYYDVRVTRFFKRAGTWARYPIPSPVDHDPDVPSLIDSQPGNRRAWRFLGDADPAAIDWSRPPVRVDVAGRLHVPAPA